MSLLRFGVHKLPAAEVELVQSLFKTFAPEENFRWGLVTKPPYDALLADGDTIEGNNADVDRIAKAVLRLTHGDPGGNPDLLARPIQPQRLKDWLKSTEHDLLQTQVFIRESQIESLTELQAIPEPMPLRFKLRRWPPASLLRGDPRRTSMATQLSRNAFSAAELAQACQIPVSECHAFLENLQTTGLVELSQGGG
jgi:hypothetical protein